MPKVTAEEFTRRGLALLGQGHADQALPCFDAALEVNPGHLDAIYNRAGALLELNRVDQALAGYDAILTVHPNLAEVLVSRGCALMRLHRTPEAIVSFEKAVSAKPGLAIAQTYLGMALRSAGRHDAAVAILTAAAGKAGGDDATVNLAGAKLHSCDWDDYESTIEALVSRVRRQNPSVNPFAFLRCSASAAEQLTCAKTFSAARFPPAAPMWNGERYAHDRIRVAYLSADFHAHATAYLMAEVFELHDRNRFDVAAISFGPDDDSDMRARLKAAFPRFIDVRDRSDIEVARMLRGFEIDIAVDLKGFTNGGRPAIFAYRPAPVQVNYLGYPGTMGAEFFDYIIADSQVIPEAVTKFYTEKVVYLPHTYQANDRKRTIAPHALSRAEAGLPDRGFVFCSFNANYKFTPEVFDVWMRLLRRIDGSVLWLLESNPAAAANLRREAERRGVARERLIFAPRMPLDKHLARQRLADLFLDTSPYSAHTTASDALWAGLPVLTSVGETFASRVAGSLLHAADLPLLITNSLEAYEARALDIALSPALAGDLRAKVGRARDKGPLFDTGLFCRHIETAYATMWERCRRGEAPAPFSV